MQFSRSYLVTGEYLSIGWMSSDKGSYYLQMQDDGNLVIYQGSGPSDSHGVIWSSGTNGNQDNYYVGLQPDGNFVMYRGTGPSDSHGAIWQTNTSVSGPAFIQMQDDGDLVLYKGTGPSDNRGFVWGSKNSGTGVNLDPHLPPTGTSKPPGTGGDGGDDDPATHRVGSTDGCFLTTAVVKSLGMPDNSEPLELARYLRDEKMQSQKDKSAVALYYKVGSVIVDRTSDEEWFQFWENHLRKITVLIKMGEHDLAKNLYTLAAAQLISKKATRYADKEMVDGVYDHGLYGVGKQWLPYSIRFVLVKLTLPIFLFYKSILLGLKKRKFQKLLEL